MKMFPVVTCLGGAALSGAGLCFMLQNFGSIAICLHLAGVLLAAPGIYFLLPFPLRQHCFLALLLTVCFVLLFPVAGVLVLLILACAFRSPGGVTEGKPAYLFADQLPSIAELDSQDGRTLSASVVDILHGPHPEARRNAILSLNGMDPKLSIPILRKGVRDSDEQVRIYAQNILSGILENHDARIRQLENRIERTPGEAKALSKLGEQLLETVYLGIAADEETRRCVLGKARNRLRQALAIEPDDQHARILLLKCCLGLGDLQSARECESSLDRQGTPSEILITWKLEILFLSRQWSQVKQTFQKYRASGYSNPKLDSLATFWLERPAS